LQIATCANETQASALPQANPLGASWFVQVHRHIWAWSLVRSS
jgi:hypothetical protein